jgi:riboflavin transporter FmnP
MIDPHTGLLGFRIGIFVVLISVWLLFIVEPGGAAFYVDLVALIAGVVFLIILAVLIRYKRH